MQSSILTNDFRQQLEQQRSRLTNERDVIIETATAQATAAIDRSLEYINGLLGELEAPASNGANGSSQAELIELDSPSPTSKRAARRRRGTKESVEDESATNKSAAPARSKDKTKSEKVLVSKPLKREFKGLTPAEALKQVVTAAPDQVFTTDQMIQILYGSLEDAVMPRARQSIALMFSHGLRRRDYIKAQEDPAQYQANPDKLEQAAE